MEEKIKNVNLSEVVKQHVFGLPLAGFYEEIYADLDSKQTRPLNKLIWQIYRRQITVQDFLSQAQALNLPGFKEKIWPGILRYDFLPLADYLEININDRLKYLSAKELEGLNIISLSDWIKKQDLALNEAEEKRLTLVLGQYLKGARIEEEIIALLAKPEKIGGLELSPEFAKSILEKFKKALEEAGEKDWVVTRQAVEIDREQGTRSKEQRTESEAQRVSPPISLPAGKAGGSQRGSGSNQRPPLVPPGRGEISPVSPNRGEAKPFIPSIQLLDQTAEELIRKSGLVIAPELRQRFKIIIISRLKDVRKLPEVRERLLASPAVGGVGLKAEEAERVVKMVEELRTPNSELRILNLKEKKEETKGIADVSPRQGERGLTSAIPAVVPPPPPPPSPPAPPKLTTFFTPVNQLTSKPVLKPPVAAMPQIPPRARPAFGRDSLGRDDIMTSSDIKPCAPSTVKIIPQEKKPPKVELAPVPPAPVKPTPITAIPQTPAGRAKVEDVAYKPRLVGPLEELKEMSLLDFRRLAPQVKVTTDKIYAKIELLGQEGYAKKIKGIEAWQKSPVNQIYLAILNESIVQGKPVDRVIGERQTGGRETLTPEEFKAVMELNRRLRY